MKKNKKIKSNISIELKSKKDIKYKTKENEKLFFVFYSIIAIILVSFLVFSLPSNNNFLHIFSLVVLFFCLPMLFLKYKKINYKYIPKEYINKYFSQMSITNNNIDCFYEIINTNDNNYNVIKIKNYNSIKNFSEMTKKEFFFYINFPTLNINLTLEDFNKLYELICEKSNCFNIKFNNNMNEKNNIYIKFFSYFNMYMKNLSKLEDKTKLMFSSQIKTQTILDYKEYVEKEFFYNNKEFLFVSMFIAFCKKIDSINFFRLEHIVKSIYVEIDIAKESMNFLIDKYNLTIYQSAYFLVRVSDYKIPYWIFLYSYCY